MTYEVITKENEVIQEVKKHFDTLEDAIKFAKKLIILKEYKKDEIKIEGPKGTYKIKNGDKNMNEEKLDKAEKITDRIVSNFSSVGKIGSHYEDNGSITVMLTNEAVEFKNDKFEDNIERILYQLGFQLNEGVNFSHEYIIDEDDDEENTPNMCNINLKIIGE